MQCHLQRRREGGREGSCQTEGSQKQLEREVCVGGFEEGFQETVGHMGSEASQTQPQCLHFVGNQ